MGEGKGKSKADRQTMSRQGIVAKGGKDGDEERRGERKR